MTDEGADLSRFVKKTNEISEDIFHMLYDAVAELGDGLVGEKGMPGVVFHNAALRASTLLTSRVLAAISFAADHRPSFSEDEFNKKANDIFEDITAAMGPVFEKHVNAVILRTGKKGGG